MLIFFSSVSYYRKADYLKKYVRIQYDNLGSSILAAGSCTRPTQTLTFLAPARFIVCLPAPQFYARYEVTWFEYILNTITRYCHLIRLVTLYRWLIPIFFICHMSISSFCITLSRLFRSCFPRYHYIYFVSINGRNNISTLFAL